MSIETNPDLWYFNGIDGSTGQYLTPPMSPQLLSEIARGEHAANEHLADLKTWHHRSKVTMRPKEGVDPKDLAKSGWGIIFAHSDNRAELIRDALSDLLDLRRQQADIYYKEYFGEQGYHLGESKLKFLARHGAGPGPVEPKKVPYYLLIAADPEQIPYSFQYQLDVQYAVGRLHFDNLEDYANYARTVVETESGRVKLPRRAVFFGVQNPDDRATNLSAKELVQPLASTLKLDQSNWDIRILLKDEATKAQLGRLLGGPETPALLFTASHGIGFPNGDARQESQQGALLCQDWPGPKGSYPLLTSEQYFSASDVTANARLMGLIAFHFACYGAGTPMMDDYAHLTSKQPSAIAPHAFVARLPQRLLGHPKGGALAVVGHVERAWGCSFLWDNTGRQLQTFESALKRLMEGHPVGSAFDYFNERYAEISSDLSEVLLEARAVATRVSPLPNELAVTLAGMWTANNDARSYAIIGDPAVRLPVTDDTEVLNERPTL